MLSTDHRGAAAHSADYGAKSQQVYGLFARDRLVTVDGGALRVSYHQSFVFGVTFDGQTRTFPNPPPPPPPLPSPSLHFAFPFMSLKFGFGVSNIPQAGVPYRGQRLRLLHAADIQPPAQQREETSFLPHRALARR